MEPWLPIVNDKVAYQDDSLNFRNPHLISCKYEVKPEENYAAFAVVQPYPSEFLWHAPGEKRAVSLAQKGLISSVNMINFEVGSVEWYGGKHFPKKSPYAYAENGGHYYLIAARGIGMDQEKVYVIDDQVYRIGKRRYGDSHSEWIQESERVLQGFSGESLLFSRITEGNLKAGITEQNYFDLGMQQPITDYQIESCEFPLKANPNFVSMLSANKRDQSLTSTFLEQQTQSAKKSLPCEQAGYYQKLTGEQSYQMTFDEQTHTYRVYIPELCALVSTAPNYLAFSPYNNFKQNQHELNIIRRGNKLYNPYLFDSQKYPILIFENKERAMNLIDTINKEAQKSDPDCRLIKYENEYYLHWAKDQAQIYSYFSPAKRLGPETENFCINKFSIKTNYNPNIINTEYYLLFDVHYP